MARREMFEVGEIHAIGISNGTVDVLMRDSSGNIILCSGSGAPPSAGSGYARGCIYIRTSNGAVYGNRGTTTSSTFYTTAANSPSSSPSTSPSSSPSST
jgi:hypothetical protein